MGASDLAQENAALRERIAMLERQLMFLTRHKSLAAGIGGETLIKNISGGSLSSYGASFDVLANNELRIEVKYSELNAPSPHASTRRWAWGKIFGESGHKAFDALVLVGVRDERYAAHYKDPQSPYVLFYVPKEKVGGLVIENGRTQSINLTTNPAKATSRASALFREFQVCESELAALLGRGD